MMEAPRALPWAGMLLPLRDEISQTAALPLCPKGAFTDQPRATPWVFNAKTMRIALKGPDNDASTQGVALGWHVIAPSGRDPANGGFTSLPQRGIHRSAQGNALGFQRENHAHRPERARQ